MSQVDFVKKIKKELKNLDKRQLAHFAWYCAVRALPFLGSKGNFNFWEKKNSQKHIFAIFHALDICAGIIFLDDDAYAADAAKRSHINIESIILQDIKALQRNEAPLVSMELYCVSKRNADGKTQV